MVPNRIIQTRSTCANSRFSSKLIFYIGLRAAQVLVHHGCQQHYFRPVEYIFEQS